MKQLHDKQILKSILGLILFIIYWSPIQSQSPIYEQNFDTNPLTDGTGLWHDVDSLWTWSSNGKADGGTYWNNRPAIGSESGGGAIMFNADSLVDAGFEWDTVNLEAMFFPEGLDPSNPAPVFLSFIQYYRAYDSHTSIEAFNPFTGSFDPLFNNDSIRSNVETSFKERVILELDRGNYLVEGFLQLRFRFSGSHYFWLIDDLEFYEAFPDFKQSIVPAIGDSLKKFGIPFDVDCNGTPYRPGQLVAQFKPNLHDTLKQAVRDTFAVKNFETCGPNGLIELWEIGFQLIPPTPGLSPTGPSTGINERAKSGSGSSNVDALDPNYIIPSELRNRLDLMRPDPSKPLISIPPQIQPRNTNDVILAILDTGVDHNHADLRDQLILLGDSAINIPADSTTDYLGWNFVDSSNNAVDDQGHGTHLAGIIIRYLNNLPVPINYKILPVKTHDEYGVGDLFDISCALHYAMNQDVDIINASWGWYGDSSEVMSLALDEAAAKNILLIAAAGNDTIDLDMLQQYPVCYSQDKANVLGVASIRIQGPDTLFTEFSNSSPSYVQIGTEGENILSSLPEWMNPDSNAIPYTGLKSGTSMAAPLVSAALANIIHTGIDSFTLVKEQLLECTKAVNRFERTIAQGRVLDLMCIKVVDREDPIPPISLSIYPNPVTDVLRIRSNAALNSPGSLHLYNGNGQLMLKKRIEASSTGIDQTLNISHLNPGMYMLRLDFVGYLTSTSKVLKMD